MTPRVFLHRWPIWGHAPSKQTSEHPWREGMTALDLIPREEWDTPRLTIHVNGKRLGWVELSEVELGPGDHVDVGTKPAGAEALTAALVSAAVSTGVSFVLSLILPRPKGPKRRGDNESPTYGWDGKSNVRGEGQPRQVVYGEIRYPPQIVDEYVKTQTVPARTDLYILLGHGEGPFESIGGVSVDNPTTTPLANSNPSFQLPNGIEINENPAQNLRAIEAHVRMGTSEQEPIPGFQEIHTISTVGATLTQQETSASTNAGTAWDLTAFPYNSNDSGVQAIWTNYAQAFTLGDDADAYTVTIGFPDGLYRIDSNGNLQDAYFAAAIRYRELDGGGSPITTGGDNGDGWIYAPPTPRVVSRHQGQFTHEIGGYFYSPAGYTPGTQGRILQADSSGMHARTASSSGGAAIDAVTPWLNGQPIDEFAVMGWIKPASLPLTGTGGANTVRPIFEWYTSSPNQRGIALMLERVSGDVGGDSTQERWRLRTRWGDGSFVRTLDDVSSGFFQFGSDNFPAVRWYHIAVTYKRNASGSNERWRIYVDGVRVREFISTASGQEIIAPAAPFYLARTTLSAVGTVEGFMRLDEFQIWKKELTAAQISAAYNQGAGAFGAADADLVAGWHFDLQDNVTNFSYASSFANASNKITTVNAAVVGESSTQLDAPVFRPGTGSFARAGHLVQVLRFNLKSNTSAIIDRSDWNSVDARLSDQLAYPNTPLTALLIPATDQLNTTTPTVTCLVRGRKVPVWDRMSVEYPSFVYQWSANPAWILVDLLTNRRYGRGGHYDFSSIDLPAFAEWADYCDQKIYDQRPRTDIHSTTTTAPVLNLLYDSTLNGGAGGIDVFMRPGFSVPATWKVGGWLGFRDVAAPPTSGISVDVNVGNIEAMEIAEIFFNGGTWVVRLKYDTATYGDPWADGSQLSIVLNPNPVTGTIEGREERFRFDGVFDTFEKPWDRVLQVCACGRAMPLFTGSQITVRVARPRSPQGVVGMGQIEPHSFRHRYVRQRVNLYVADILDRDQNYKRKPIERMDPTLEAGANETAINRDNVELVGIVRQSQANRDLDFRLNIQRLVEREGEFVTGIEGLTYQPGDLIVLAHDIVPWGVSSRFDANQSGTSITLDRAIEVVSGETSYIRARMNRIGQTGSGSSVADYMEVREITSSAGTYAAGATITIASAFTVSPEKDDPYCVYRESEQMIVEIAEITLTPERKRRVKWVQYVAAAYDVEEPSSPIEIEPLAQSSALGAGDAPDQVRDLTMREGARYASDGTFRTDVALAWTLEPSTAPNVASVTVWSRVAGESLSPWEEVARLNGSATSGRFRVNVDSPTTQLEFAVQPISITGERLTPDHCARVTGTLRGSTSKPEAPTNLRATMNGDQVTYHWDPPANSRGLTYELRRAGWALGQIIGTAGPGSTSFGPCANWANSKANAAGDPPPLILIRSRDLRGVYSDACALEGFAPSVLGSRLVADWNSLDANYPADQAWEDYGDGWLPAGTPTAEDPSVDGLEVVADVVGRPVLQFETGALEGTYSTGEPNLDPRLRPERCYVEAYAVATQIPPITIDEMTLPLDHPLAASRELEGVVGAAGCTLEIEWRYRASKSEDWGPWQTYRPGAYFFSLAQFRITLTRPDSSWQVALERFGTRISSIPPERFERNDLTNYLTRRR